MIALLTTTILTSWIIGQANSKPIQTMQPSSIPNTGLITYHGVAQPLSKALEGIEDAGSGKIKIHVSDALKNEVILVDVTNVPLKDLLQRIAKVEFAKWRFAGNSAFLALDVKAEKIQDDDTYANRADLLLKNLSTSEPSLKRKNTDANSNLDETRSESYGNKSKDAKELLKLIGTKVIVSLPKGKRIVFSNQPTAMQKPFPAGSTPFLNQLINQIRIPKSLSDPVIAKTDLVLANPNYSQGFGISGDFLPVEALLKIFNSEGIELGAIDLAIPDFGQGNDLNNLRASIGFGTNLNKSRDDNNAPLTQPIKLSGASQTFYTSFKAFHNVDLRNKETGSPEYLKFALDPVKFEPLTLNGALIDGAARAYKVNVVASLPDSLYIPIAFPGFGKKLPSPVAEISALEGYSAIHVSNSNGWLTIFPSLPSVCRAKRIDREFLKKAVLYLHGISDVDAFSLGQVAVEFHGEISPLAETYFAAANSSLIMDLSSQNWKLLEFYGLLTDSERNELNDGKRVPYSSLSKDAAAVARALVYGADGQLFTDEPPKNIPEGTEFSGGKANLFNPNQNPAENYESEPTEVAPNGISTEALVTGIVAKSFVYHAQMTPGSNKAVSALMSKIALTPSMVGQDIVTDEQLGSTSSSNDKPRIVAIKQGLRTSLMIKIYITPTVYAGGTLFQDKFSDSPKAFSLDNLPKDVKKAVESIRKLYTNGNGGAAANAGSGP